MSNILDSSRDWYDDELDDEYGYESDDEYDGVYDAFTATFLDLKDTSPMIKPIATYLLIVINFIVFLATIWSVYSNPWSVGVTPIQLFTNPLNPLVLLSMFSHAGIIHILGNMAFLYVVGDNVEAAMGRLRYLAFYLLCGLFATLAQSLCAAACVALGSYSLLMLPMMGASGAIAGVMGAYVYLYPGSRKVQCFCFRLVCYCKTLPMRYIVLGWLLLQFILPLFNHRVAIFAHIGGLVAGFALAPVFAKKSNVEKLREQFRKGLYKGPRIDEYEVGRVGLGASGLAIAVLSLLALVIVASLAIASLSLIPGDGIYIVSKYVREHVCFNPYTEEKYAEESYECFALAIASGETLRIVYTNCPSECEEKIFSALKRHLKELESIGIGRELGIGSGTTSGSEAWTGFWYEYDEYYVNAMIIAKGDPQPSILAASAIAMLSVPGVILAIHRQSQYEVL